jgi:hypothetical protein
MCVCVCTAEDSPNYFNKCHPNEVFAYVGTRHSANRARKVCFRFEAFPLQLCMSRKKYIVLLVCSETWALPRFLGGIEEGEARKFAYTRTVEPFKYVFAGCGRFVGLCIGTQLASQPFIDPFAIFPFRFNVSPRPNNTDRATATCRCS